MSDSDLLSRFIIYTLFRLPPLLHQRPPRILCFDNLSTMANKSYRATGCCCCLFSVLWKLLVAIIVIVGLAVLIFWLIVQPRSFKFYASDAHLSQFEYANNTLRYNLVLNFTARNPNKKLGLYYDDVEATALYQDERFSNTDVITFRNSFRQDKKMTHPMSGVFSGQQLLPLDPLQVSQYNQDMLAGAFDIDVKLKFEIRFRLGNFITGSYRPKVWCGLRIPLSANGTTTASGFQFQPTRCRVDF